MHLVKHLQHASIRRIVRITSLNLHNLRMRLIERNQPIILDTNTMFCNKLALSLHLSSNNSFQSSTPQKLTAPKSIPSLFSLLRRRPPIYRRMIKEIHKIPLIKLDTIPNVRCNSLAHILTQLHSSTHTKATQSYDTPSSKASSSPPPQRTPTPTPTSPIRSSRASWPSSPCGSPPPG